MNPTPLSAAAAVASAPAKRVYVTLSDAAYSELSEISRSQRRSMNELIRLALGLLKLVIEAERKGHRLVVTTEEGVALKQIILPP